MIFSTLDFFVFILVLLLLYYQVKKNHQWFILLLASSAFIGYFSVNFLVYTYLVIGINYLLGKEIEKQQERKKRYWIYLTGMIFNIGQLVFFKYINFLIENFNTFIGIFEPGTEIKYINLIIPIGISYYTFECIGYLIEIYRRQIIRNGKRKLINVRKLSILYKSR